MLLGYLLPLSKNKADREISDRHVGWIGELEDTEDMDRYFSGILIPQV